ncbi:Kelch-like protein 17 [Orchesella cincta]|uniref:Kelch-like protein diablo n=1 Tax=Orchesella cincta TaxID=48709 RepID=A0A1D2NLX7_ORCCI|nr:Kelch-like protein 17 [Orchesella cincta]
MRQVLLFFPAQLGILYINGMNIRITTKMIQPNPLIVLCDVIINVGNVSIPAHKVVLAAISPYFHAMFNDDMAEKTQKAITIHEIDPDAMKQLIDYAYAGDILITEENALLPASSLLQISMVREACCKFLLRQLHPSNCLGIRNFADAHACKELQTRSHRFALQNFTEVMHTEEFVLLPLEEVEELLGSPQLNVASEETAYEAGMAWVKHDVENRRLFLSKLLSKVRMPLLGRKFLMTSVDSESLIRDDPGCKELLLEAMRYHLLPEQRASLTSERTQERRPDGMRPYIFAVGGGSLFAIHSECECYNPRSPIAAMGTRRSCLGLCTLNGILFAVGGYDGASCLQSCERYDPLTGIWSCCPALSQRRRYCKLAAMDNCVWAVGGLDASSAISNVERLDPREGRWQSVPALSQRRSSAGVAALDGNLYCVGGSDGSSVLASAEKFDPRRLRWETIASMHSRRSTHELVAVDGNLYGIGGNDGSSSLSTVERYDYRLNKWSLVTAMLTRRSSLGCAVLDCLPIDRIARPC